MDISSSHDKMITLRAGQQTLRHREELAAGSSEVPEKGCGQRAPQRSGHRWKCLSSCSSTQTERHCLSRLDCASGGLPMKRGCAFLSAACTSTNLLDNGAPVRVCGANFLHVKDRWSRRSLRKRPSPYPRLEGCHCFTQIDV